MENTGKLEPIKKLLNQYMNYGIQDTEYGFCIVFPFRYWSDGDGMSIHLMVDEQNNVYLQDDDFCIHNTLCMIPDDPYARNAVRLLARDLDLPCIYGDQENESPHFYEELRDISYYQQGDRIRQLIISIEDFVKKLSIFNGIADRIDTIAKVQEEFLEDDEYSFE